MLCFLKLGGSLITDKTRPYTPRPDILENLAGQVAEARRLHPDLRLVLGHGSGSFGHQAASRHGTRHGVVDAPGWAGFAEVWYQASTLDRLVVDALVRSGLPAVTFSPLASVTAHDGRVFIWDLFPLRSALGNGLLPVIHGDVAFDQVRGGTVLSTEDLFEHLARELKPDRILLAGLEPGVWQDFPARQHLFTDLTPGRREELNSTLGPAQGADVTGGMLAKVDQMLSLVAEIPGLEVLIFSGEEPGNLGKALAGGSPGTRLHR